MLGMASAVLARCRAVLTADTCLTFCEGCAFLRRLSTSTALVFLPIPRAPSLSSAPAQPTPVDKMNQIDGSLYIMECFRSYWLHTDPSLSAFHLKQYVGGHGLLR